MSTLLNIYCIAAEISTNNYQDIEIKYRDLCFSRKKIIAILLACMTVCSTLIVLHQAKSAHFSFSSTVDSCFDLVESRQHVLASNEVIGWATDHPLNADSDNDARLITTKKA